MSRTVTGVTIVLALSAAVVCARMWGAPNAEKGASLPQEHEIAATQPPQLHPVTVRPVPSQGVVTTGVHDPLGNPVALNCQSCHAIRQSNSSTRQGIALNEFHQGLTLHHGNLACVACHNPADNYATLRLADGTALAFSESMQLCAQCHGPQYRDYQRGSHGGMTGYWDLRRGPRVRNHCQHCHDPHAPQFPKVLPVAEPRDRFPPAQGNPTHD